MMKIPKIIVSGLILTAFAVCFETIRSSQAAPGTLFPSVHRPPVIIYDDFFLPQFWTVTAEATGGASYTVEYQHTGGVGDTPFRFMSHRLPPVTATIPPFKERSARSITARLGSSSVSPLRKPSAQPSRS